MESSKKLYILIGILVSVVLVLVLVRFFVGGNLFQVKEKPAASSCPEQVTYQGNVYNTVRIGGQCWLAENLRAFSYRDGTAIPMLTDSAEWDKDRQGAYTCYYNQEQNCHDYGALYNWYAVNNEKGLCPEGWSVPTQEQWTEADKYDFKAIFGGFRNSAGPYSFLDKKGFWWTATPSEDFAFAMVMDKDNDGIRRVESSKSSGFSVRCIQD